MKPSDSSPPSSSQLDGLATKLASADLSAMATGLASDPQVDALWNEYADSGLYTAVIEDGKRSSSVRFGAVLVLLSKNKDRFGNTSSQLVAQVLATALKENLAVWTWPWGRLWADVDPLGHLGRVFLELGRPAVPALEALLDDPAPRDAYEGSEEATEMAMRHYRVKDFAAFYIARILQVDLPWEQSVARRDETIAKLRTQIH
jgi:hypothetical protein